jgi:hypothetical protein
MTGTLQVPAGTEALPGLAVGASGIGLSSVSSGLSLSTGSVAHLRINSAGTVSINDNGHGFNTAGVVHNDSSGNLSSSLVVGNDIAVNTIQNDRLQTISSAGKVANSATTATPTNTNNTIVSRDNTGTAALNVTGDVTGNLFGNATTATTATTATIATNFTGSLSGDVTGTQSGTVVSFVGGQTAANVASATVLAHAATSADMANTIVMRDGSGDFATNMITIDGTPTFPTDAVTKLYVDNAVATGIVIHSPARLVSTTNNPTTAPIPNGAATIDGFAVADSDRILLQAQTNTVNNGLWVANTTGDWTRPADFQQGTKAGRAYVLIQQGTIYAGSSWLCSTPDATISNTGTGDAIAFQEFTSPSQTTGNNVGADPGTAQVYVNTNGTVLNFASLSTNPATVAGSYLSVSNIGGVPHTNVQIATNATPNNVNNAIVARGAAGQFSAGAITATNGVNVTAGGATIAGNLVMAPNGGAPSTIQFQDTAGTNFVGLQASPIMSTNYTVNLPTVAPTANQVLNATSPTQLAWTTQGGSVLPASNRTIYVTKSGSDITGDGSFSNPYASLSKAVATANALPPSLNPVAISITTGIYTEDNSAGPITITAAGVSIFGDSSTGVIIRPLDVTKDLLASGSEVFLNSFTLDAGFGSGSTATGLVLSGTNNGSTLTNLEVLDFQTGIECSGAFIGLNLAYSLNFCTFINNGTGLFINDTTAFCDNCDIGGSILTTANTGVAVSGASAQALYSGGIIADCATGCAVSSNSDVKLSGVTFTNNNNSIVQDGASKLYVQGCSFRPTDSPANVNDIQISGAGTTAKISDAIFDASDTITAITTALRVTNQASCIFSGGQINKYTNGLVIGTSGDTASTNLQASNIFITNSTNDIIQTDTSTLNFVASSATGSKITISNTPSHVTLAYFDQEDNNALNIGNRNNIDTALLHASVANPSSIDPQINYKSSLYATSAIGYQNPTGTASTLFALSSNNTNIDSITTDNTKAASLQLISDTGSPIGTTSSLRGWNIGKTGTTANLNFNYQNTDTIGQAARGLNTVMQLDGFNNQLNFPTATTVPLPTNTVAKLVWAGDTNLYREAAGVLATDTNLIVGGLTPNTALATNASSQLVSSVTTATELGYLSGVTGNVQTQLNSKVAKAGDTMTGTLVMPNGTAALPALAFGTPPNIGLSSTASGLSLSTNGLERLKISSGGSVSIDTFTMAGVVHNDASGNLTTSLIVNADVDPAAAISDTKLATITSAGKVADTATTANSIGTHNAIVKLDSSGNFVANNMTGSVTGTASGNLALTGGTLSGNLTLPAGAAGSPSLNFTNSLTTGLSVATANTLVLSTSGTNQLQIGPTGGVIVAAPTISTPALTVTGNAVGATSAVAINQGASPAGNGLSVTGSATATTSAVQITGGAAATAQTITAAAGQAALTVTGNVGFGTTSPYTQLVVPGLLPAAQAGSANTGGSSQWMYVQGRYAYVVNNSANTLQIFDISTTTPVAVSFIGTSTGPFGVYVQGKYAYVVCTAGGPGVIQIYDVSNVASPLLVGSATTGTAPRFIYVQGRYAYVANFTSNTVQIFDVSIPASPALVGSVTTNAGPRTLYVEGRYVYVVNFTANNFQIIDAIDPTNPVTVGSAVTTGTAPDGIYVQGKYAYVVNFTTSSLQIFDVSNPASVPAAIGSISTGTGPVSVYVYGRYAYVANFTANNFQAFDVSTPTAPALVGSVPTNAGPRILVTNGRFGYLVNQSGTSTLQVFDLGGAYIQQFEAGAIETETIQTRGNATINNDLDVRGGATFARGFDATGNSNIAGQLFIPGNIPTAAAGSVSTGSSPRCVYVQGRYAYVISNTANTFEIYDVSNPTTPISISSITTGAASGPFWVYVQGQYAYVVNGTSNTLLIFDVSNVAAPTQVSSISMGAATSPRSVYVQGRYAYIVNNTSATLRAVDLNNPNAPVLAGSVAVGASPRTVCVQGRYAYIVCNTANTLEVYDVSNPYSIPAAVGSVSTGAATGPFAVAVQGRYAYVILNTTNSLQIYDISNPASIPAAVGTAVTSAGPRAVYVQGRYAFVTNQTANNIQVFDVSTPSAPVSVGTFTTGSAPIFTYVEGRYAYVVNNTANTLQVFDLGGAYIQQLETGGIETGTLQTRTNLTVNNDLDVRGGATFARGFDATGGSSITPASGPALTINGSATAATSAMSINQNNSSSTGNALLITGAATPSGAPLSIVIGSSAQNAITTSNGVVGAPAYSFTSSTNTGIYAPAAGQIALAVAGAQRALVDNTASFTYGSKYKMHAYRSTTQAVNTTTATLIFDTVLFDTNSNYNNTTGVYTAPVTGIYQISTFATASTPTVGSGTITLNLQKNGSGSITGYTQQNFIASQNNIYPVAISGFVSLNVGDTLQVQATTSLSTNITANQAYLSIHFMSF